MKVDSKEEKGSFSTDPEPEDATKTPERLTDFTANQICLGFFNIRRLLRHKLTLKRKKKGHLKKIKKCKSQIDLNITINVNKSFQKQNLIFTH